MPIYFRGKKELQPTPKVKLTHEDDVCTLTVTNITPNSAGVYKCVAKNTAGEATHKATIKVTGMPLMTC